MRPLFKNACVSVRASASVRSCVRACVRACVHCAGAPSVHECAIVRLFVSYAVGLARTAAFV